MVASTGSNFKADRNLHVFQYFHRLKKPFLQSAVSHFLSFSWPKCATPFLQGATKLLSSLIYTHLLSPPGKVRHIFGSTDETVYFQVRLSDDSSEGKVLHAR